MLPFRPPRPDGVAMPGGIPPPRGFMAPPVGIPGVGAMRPPMNAPMMMPPRGPPMMFPPPSLPVRGPPGAMMPGMMMVPRPMSSHQMMVGPGSAETTLSATGPLNVFVGKLPTDLNDSYVRNILEKCGHVVSWKRTTDPVTNKPKAFGYCTFAGATDVLRALRLLNGFSVDSKQILVKVDTKTQANLDQFTSSMAQEMKQEQQEQDDQVRNVLKRLEDERSGLMGGSQNHPDSWGDLLKKQAVAGLKESGAESAPVEAAEGTEGGDQATKAVAPAGKNIQQKMILSEIEKFRLAQEQREQEMEQKRRDALRERLRREEESRRRAHEEEVERVAEEKKIEPNHEKEDEAMGAPQVVAEEDEKKVPVTSEDLHGEQASLVTKSDGDETKKEKEKTRERDRDRESSRDRDRKDRDRDRDRERRKRSTKPRSHSRSRERSHERSSRRRRRDRSRSPSRSRSRSRSHDRDRDRKRDRDRRRHRDRDGERYRDRERDRTHRRRRHSSTAEEDEKHRDNDDDRRSKRRKTSTASDREALKDPVEEAVVAAKPAAVMKVVMELKMPLGGTKKDKPVAAPTASLFTIEDEPVEKPVREFIRIDFAEEERLAAAAVRDRVAATVAKINSRTIDVKALISKIPTEKNELFAYPIDWEAVDQHKLVKEKMHPWVIKKVHEYLGEEDATMISFILNKITAHATPREILTELKEVLEDEAEVFVQLLWRKLAFEALRASISATSA